MIVIPSLIQAQYFVYLIALLFVVCANQPSLFSFSSLYNCKLADISSWVIDILYACYRFNHTRCKCFCSADSNISY